MITTERTIPKVDDNYPGFCCAGWDYLICDVVVIDPKNPEEWTSIWGSCQNPDCPQYQENIGPENDPFRGVSQNYLDDFEDALEEKGLKVAT